MMIRWIAFALFLSPMLQARPHEDFDALQFSRHPSECCGKDSVANTMRVQYLEYSNTCALTRSYQLNIEADPISMGRYALGLQIQLVDALMLDIPLYFEHSSAATPFGKAVGLFNTNLDSYWGIGAGIGLKWRITEWMWKASFYVEPRLKIGYYSQKAGLIERDAFSITPELILGWERVFETGFVFGASIGIEKLIAISLHPAPLPYVPVISVTPSFQVGYAW